MSVSNLSPRQHIRHRPGMYIGGTGLRGLHHLIYELLDHMAEEAYLGRCDRIEIEILDNHQVTIADNSPGLPTEPYKDTGLTRLDALLQMLALSKSDILPDVYRGDAIISGGLHGTGLAVVNALCDELIIENHYAGARSRHVYKQGVLSTSPARIHDKRAQTGGTHFTLIPDFSIFEKLPFDRDRIETRAHELAILTPGLTISIRDRRDNSADSIFQYNGGMVSRVEALRAGAEPFHQTVHIRQEAPLTDNRNRDVTVSIELAFQFSAGNHTHLHGYVNTVRTEAGTHLAGLRAGLWSVFNEYIQSHPYRFKDTGNQSLPWDTLASGLVAIVSVRHPDPQFTSPTKILLRNPEIVAPITGMVYSVFGSHDYQQQEILQRIIQHKLNHQ